jgi:hypothetical protein
MLTLLINRLYPLSEFMILIAVSKVTGYGLDDQGWIPGMDRNISLRQHVQTDAGCTQRPL